MLVVVEPIVAHGIGLELRMHDGELRSRRFERQEIKHRLEVKMALGWGAPWTPPKREFPVLMRRELKADRARPWQCTGLNCQTRPCVP